MKTILRSTVAGLVLLSGLVSAGGCSRSRDRIESYEVPRLAAPAETAVGSDRMLGAMIPLDAQGWFFKVAGPEADVAKIATGFDQLVRSVRVAGEAGQRKLQWTVPEGWEERPGTGMRAATFVAPSAPKLDISLIALPMLGGDLESYLLENVNRWRGQMKLRPVSDVDLPSNLQEIQVGDLSVRLVDLKGTFSSGGMGGPMSGLSGGGAGSGGPGRSGPGSGGIGPATGVPPNDAVHAGVAGVEGPAAAAPSGIKYTTPEGWQPGRMSSMRKAAFNVQEGDQKLEVTVIDLAEGAGDVLANVNRWREQVGLKPLESSELSANVQTLPVSGHEASFVELVGTGPDGAPTTILGVIAPSSGAIDGRIWFIKATGSAQLAQREKDRFLEFAKSVTF
ncbi:MAG: hypothetical protein U0795_12075 [Pirellulales bacterium]